MVERSSLFASVLLLLLSNFSLCTLGKIANFLFILQMVLCWVLAELKKFWPWESVQDSETFINLINIDTSRAEGEPVLKLVSQSE